MLWSVTHGDILDTPADVLVCSANVFLTLSGGVGGSLLQRYGTRLQDELQAELAVRGTRHVPRGTVIVTRPADVRWRAIIHAVAVDGMYESSSTMVAQVVRESFQHAAQLGATSVALTALATGFGKLTMQQFAQGVALLRGEVFAPVEHVTIVVRHRYEADSVREALGGT